MCVNGHILDEDDASEDVKNLIFPVPKIFLHKTVGADVVLNARASTRDPSFQTKLREGRRSASCAIGAQRQ